MLETVLLATLVPVAWVTGFLVTARLYYQKVRPSKIPLCGKQEGPQHKHVHLLRVTDPGYRDVGGCYRRYKTIDTEGEAVQEAVAAGFLWPLMALFMGAKAAIMFGQSELPEEKAARLRQDLREREIR